jgi:NAD(P)-dependent dehydrogenase (short-subunit alcohol dehydrogenase family)
VTGELRFDDQVVLVTGGSRGVGRGIAQRFADAGARVAICGRNEPDSLPDGWLFVAGDVRDADQVDTIVGRVVDEFGRLDVLVNNAAFQMAYESFLEIPPDEIDFVFRTNIISMFHLCQAAVPKMPEGSTIVNTTSIQAAQPSPQLLHYAATKGAISTFTKGLAQEVAERGIRVNAVAPGPIWTPLVVMSFPAEKNAEFGSDTPLGRPGQPGELAPIYVFLATEASQYISGEVIGATGGKPLH